MCTQTLRYEFKRYKRCTSEDFIEKYTKINNKFGLLAIVIWKCSVDFYRLKEIFSRLNFDCPYCKRKILRNCKSKYGLVNESRANCILVNCGLIVL